MSPTTDRCSPDPASSELRAIAVELQELASALDPVSGGADAGVTREQAALDEAASDDLHRIRDLVESLLDRAHGDTDDWEGRRAELLGELDTGLDAIGESFDYLHGAIVDPPTELADLAERARSIERGLFWWQRKHGDR
jgi:hypothetical protein